nr:E3 ubiquitin-protein ligase CBLL2 [Dasypus novemcinctus]
MPADEEEFDDNEEGLADNKEGKLLGIKKNAFEDCKINIIGEKDCLPVHFCEKCELPIKIYGRMIPCKHVFCYGCAILYKKKGDKTCPGCSNPVLRTEKHSRGSVFMCGTIQGCKRTYLSERDLQAHVNHRHKRAGKPVTHAPPVKVRLHDASPPIEMTDGFKCCQTSTI